MMIEFRKEIYNNIHLILLLLKQFQEYYILHFGFLLMQISTQIQQWGCYLNMLDIGSWLVK